MASVTPRAATSVCFLVNGALVGTWVADTPEEVERFLAFGTDVIATNDPAMALEVVRRVS